MEQIDYNLLFHWFVGLDIDAAVWDASTFSKDRDRLLEADVERDFLTTLIFTATPSISSSTALTCERRRFRACLTAGAGSLGANGSITAGTNDGGGVFVGTIRPWSSNCLRSSRRQVNSCDGLKLCRRATAQAVS